MDLGLPIRWLDSDDASFLHWNYRCIAITRQHGAVWDSEIHWQDQVHRQADASRDEAKDRIERFVRAQPGLPGRARR